MANGKRHRWQKARELKGWYKRHPSIVHPLISLCVDDEKAYIFDVKECRGCGLRKGITKDLSRWPVLVYFNNEAILSLVTLPYSCNGNSIERFYDNVYKQVEEIEFIEEKEFLI